MELCQFFANLFVCDVAGLRPTKIDLFKSFLQSYLKFTQVGPFVPWCATKTPMFPEADVVGTKIISIEEKSGLLTPTSGLAFTVFWKSSIIQLTVCTGDGLSEGVTYSNKKISERFYHVPIQLFLSVFSYLGSIPFIS